MADEGTLRRQPRQQRSRQRVNAILDAAEQIFAEIGFSAATTNAIAARANANIASLYRYFPNKAAILEAVVARYQAEYSELAQHVFAPESANLPIHDLVARMSQAAYELHRRHNVIRPFFVGVGESSSEFAATEMEIYRNVLHMADQALAARIPALSPAQRQTALQVILRVMQALVALAHVSAGERKAWVIEAVQIMTQAYLDSLAADKNSI